VTRKVTVRITTVRRTTIVVPIPHRPAPEPNPPVAGHESEHPCITPEHMPAAWDPLADASGAERWRFGIRSRSGAAWADAARADLDFGHDPRSWPGLARKNRR
jgi:hypothetical protein